MSKKNQYVKKIDVQPPIVNGGAIFEYTDSVLGPSTGYINAPETFTIVNSQVIKSAQASDVVINVTWTKPKRENPTDYLIEIGLSLDGNGDIVNPERYKVNGQQLSAGIPAKAATAYYIRILAVLKTIVSDWTNASVYPYTTISDILPPTAISAITVAFNNFGDLITDWTEPTTESYKDAKIQIYNAAGSILYETDYRRGGRYIWSAAQNYLRTSGVPLKSAQVRLQSRSWSNTLSSTVASGIATYAVPITPSGVVSTWDGDTGLAGSDITFTWSTVPTAKEYTIVLDGKTYKSAVPRFNYSFANNVADHVPTLASGDYALAYTIQATDYLGQNSIAASGTFTNAAPNIASISATSFGGFSQISIGVLFNNYIKDFYAFRYRIYNGASATILEERISPATQYQYQVAASGIFQFGVTIIDQFGRMSSEYRSGDVIADGVSISSLRATTDYIDSISNTSATLSALKDGLITPTVAYTAGEKWIEAQRVNTDRMKQFTVQYTSTTLASGFIAMSNDGSTYTYYSGPAVSGTLTKQASIALARANAFVLASGTITRYNLPEMFDGRFARLYHNGANTRNFGEYYPRRLVQADDIEAESISSIHIGAYAINADRIFVTSLSALTASMGALTMDGVISISTSGGIYQGTGSFASPTTGLKIYNSSGVGRLTTYSGGIAQVDFDTTGRLIAAGGNLKVDSTGVAITTGPSSIDDVRSYKFMHPSIANTVLARLSASKTTGAHNLYLASESIAAEDSSIVMSSSSPTGVYNGIRLAIDKAGTLTYFDISNSVGNAKTFTFSNGDVNMEQLKIYGSLNVGSSTGAVNDGQIGASGYVVSYGTGGAIPGGLLAGIVWDSANTRGLLLAINGSNGNYQPLHIEGSVVQLKYLTTRRIELNVTGIGFFAVTPVAQQTGGAATADLTYDATERDMINRMYTALRNYGLLT